MRAAGTSYVGLMLSPLETPPRWQSVPATSLIIALAVLVAAISEFLGKPFVLDWLAYTPVEFTGRQFELVPPGDQYWRYITPVFVHSLLLLLGAQYTTIRPMSDSECFNHSLIHLTWHG